MPHKGLRAGARFCSSSPSILSPFHQNLAGFAGREEQEKGRGVRTAQGLQTTEAIYTNTGLHNRPKKALPLGKRAENGGKQ